MGRREPTDRVLARIAATQHGVFSRAQAFAAGASASLVTYRLKTGRWEPACRGVYRIAGTPETKLQRVMAACLACGARASHRCAAVLLGFDGIRFPGIELIAAPTTGRKPFGAIVHRVGPVPDVDAAVVEAIPVTTPARTFVDLAAVVPKAILERALDDAIRRRLVTMKQLCARVDALARRGRDGIGALRAVIAERTDDDDSRFAMLLGRAIRRAGLPPPAPQYRVRLYGRIVARVDFAYPAARLAIEADSYRWHAGRARWKTDLERRNILTLLGWRIIHVTHDELDTRPDDVTARIAQALAGAPLPVI